MAAIYHDVGHRAHRISARDVPYGRALPLDTLWSRQNRRLSPKLFDRMNSTHEMDGLAFTTTACVMLEKLINSLNSDVATPNSFGDVDCPFGASFGGGP